jgi:hypothetical protein
MDDTAATAMYDIPRHNLSLFHDVGNSSSLAYAGRCFEILHGKRYVWQNPLIVLYCRLIVTLFLSIVNSSLTPSFTSHRVLPFFCLTATNLLC